MERKSCGGWPVSAARFHRRTHAGNFYSKAMGGFYNRDGTEEMGRGGTEMGVEG